MRLNSALIPLAALLTAVRADFDIYYVERRVLGAPGPTPAVSGYQALDADADVDCGQVKNQVVVKRRHDVSGSRRGVGCHSDKNECRGDGNPDGIVKMEMNFGDDEVHWTIYRDRDWGMYDLSDKRVAQCEPLGHNHYQCNPIIGQHDKGYRLMRCRSGWTAGEINKHR